MILFPICCPHIILDKKERMHMDESLSWAETGLLCDSIVKPENGNLQSRVLQNCILLYLTNYKSYWTAYIKRAISVPRGRKQNETSVFRSCQTQEKRFPTTSLPLLVLRML